MILLCRTRRVLDGTAVAEGAGGRMGMRDVDVDADGIQGIGYRVQELAGGFGDYVTALRERLHGASFPWPDEGATVVSSLYAQALDHLLGRADELRGLLGDGGGLQV